MALKDSQVQYQETTASLFEEMLIKYDFEWAWGKVRTNLYAQGRVTDKMERNWVSEQADFLS